MKAIELLKAIVDSGMSCQQMGFVTTPIVAQYPPSWTREEVWVEWYKDVFASDECVILSEGKELLYAYANNEGEQSVFEELNGYQIDSRYNDRIYLFEVE